jgi:hypothetical protein
MRASVCAAIALALFCCEEPKPSGDGAPPPESPAAEREGAEKRAAAEPCRPEIAAPPPSGEGMWPWTSLGELDEEKLRRRGLEISLEDLWTEGSGGLLRAAVGLRGCSASFVSAEGLMITNHHCAFSAIQRNSSEERNLLSDGFTAASRRDELDGRGLRAYVFARQSDVTVRVLEGLGEDAGDLERGEQIERREKELVAECENRGNARCRVTRNNDGLSFTLLEYAEIPDVRLVAAPPRALGEYGGEIDNWHWPRHTMDFALLRAYVGPDGKPAEHAPDNVPYRPERHFRVGADGVNPGELVMVAGTPYSTARYRTAAEVRRDAEWYYPLRVSLFSEWLEALERTCEKIPDSCLRTASTTKSLDNALTNARGMIEGLERRGVLEGKRELEKRWRQWVAADPSREKWAGALDALSGHVRESAAGRDRDFLLRYLLRGAKLLGFARTITKWAAEQAEPDEEREPGFQDRDRERILSDLRNAQAGMHTEADRRVMRMFLERFADLPPEQRPRALDRALGGDWSERSIERLTERLYAATDLDQQSRRLELFGADLAELRSSDDAMIELALELMPELDARETRVKEREGALSRLRPPWIESLIEMLGGSFYPDANAGPRVSFATVAGYSPRDGVWHLPQTTLSGLAAKHTGEKPFDAPEEVLRAIEDGENGRWADPQLDDVPVCFLSNADTTGGNSGSPALNGRGRLVGINFDRVYANIAGDYGYDPELSRNIMVEIRSVLWYLDRVAGAAHLLRELKAPSN